VAGAPGPATAATFPLELDAGERWLSISGVGFDEGTVYAFRDLTEERMLEKIRSDFVATISHELRTPLASVYGAALTLIEREATLGHEHRARLLGVIASEADRLAHIVDDVLLASRLDSRRLAFSIESCDAMQALERTVEAARAHLPAGVRIKVEVGDAFPPIAADAEKLRQILGNLIDNAVKYSPNGGLVDVSVEQRGQRLRFTVRDQGIGIPPEERERIFEKFYRLDPDLLRGVGGTGLGLYISRELTQRMGGAIWVDSAHGGGSIFYLELPLAFAPQEGENGRDGREAVPARVADQ
jgi:signal transduction histidine kinase